MDAITYEHDVRGWPLRALIGGAVVAAVARIIASPAVRRRLGRGIFHAINDLPTSLLLGDVVAQLAGLLLLPLVVAVGALAFRASAWPSPWSP